MSALEKRYRRNFVVAVLLHVVLVGGIVLLDQTNLFGNRTAPPEVIEGIIIGDPPVGPGTGLGRYHAPAARTQSAAPPSAPAVAPTPADEELPAPPQPRAALTRVDPNEIAIQSRAKARKVAEEKEKEKAAEEAKLAAARKNAAAAAAKKTLASAKKTSSTGSSGASEDDFKQRLMKELQSEEGGTSRGDGKLGGGGSGKGPIGRPDGIEDGVSTGIGKGTAYASYYRHIHDAMYDAWSQSGSSLDKKLMTSVWLRIARDGSITDVSLKNSSGNRAMDESVLEAARKVLRLDPPPSGLIEGDTAKVSVEFQVEG